ncbi:unnamed protein product [Dicrocoelium dendriticum]|nr:unnamed protein product [Dicrocoelium dendriticum]
MVPHFLRNINWVDFSALLRVQNWDHFFLSSDIKGASDIFYDNVAMCLSILASCDNTRVSSKYANNAKDKRKIRVLTRTFERTHDFSVLLRLQRLIIEMDMKHRTRLMQEERRAVNSSNTSQLVTALLRKRRGGKTDLPSHIVMPEGDCIDSPIAMAEAFNSYFARSFNVEKETLDLSTSFHFSEQVPAIELSVATIKRMITCLRPSYRPGPDGISSALIKHGGDDIPLIVLNIFSLSLQSGQYPERWKTATVIPRHKSGSKTDIRNYRPISHTAILSRMLERIVKEHLVSFLISHKLLSPSQHGFLKSRSCVTCQVDFLNHLTEAIDSGLQCIVIFLDMQKAFDRVPHKKLLCKLSKYGVTNPLYSWIQSYLVGRSQVVDINGYISSPRPVTSGVVQGSVLGPLLFLLYINDLVSVIQFGKPYLFADDLKVVYTFPGSQRTAEVNNIQSDLEAIERWADMWQMTFATSKCSILSYGCQIAAEVFRLHDVVIPISQSVRDLGLRYSSSLNFSEHTNHIVKKAKQSVGLICHLLTLKETRLIAFKISIWPLLEYCCAVFSNLRKADLRAIENVQRAFTKRIFGCSTALSYRDRCKQLNLEPLWLRRMQLNLCFLHKLAWRKAYIGTYQLHFRENTTYELRDNECIFYLPKFKSSLRRNFYLLRYGSIWNKLPKEIRCIEHFCMFKKMIKAYLSTDRAKWILNIQFDDEKLYEEGPDHV